MYISTLSAHLYERLTELVKTPVAWVTGFFLFFAEAISSGRLIIYIIVAASALDLICGIAVAIKRKQFALSELMRQSVEKLVVYGGAMLIFLGIDLAIDKGAHITATITAGVVGIIITLTESWSVLALLLILYPNNPFLKFMKKYLAGEIARKLGCDVSEVDAVLGKLNRKPQPRAKNGQFIKK